MSARSSEGHARGKNSFSASTTQEEAWKGERAEDKPFDDWGLELPEMLLGTARRVASLAARDAEGRRAHASSQSLRSELWGFRPGRVRGATGVTRLSRARPLSLADGTACFARTVSAARVSGEGEEGWLAPGGVLSASASAE